MIWITFLVAALISLLITPRVRSYAISKGFYDNPTDTSLKIHKGPIPDIGGLAIFLALTGGISIGLAWGGYGKTDSMKIPLARPDITETERRYVLEVLNTPNLSLGPKIAEWGYPLDWTSHNM